MKPLNNMVIHISYNDVGALMYYYNMHVYVIHADNSTYSR